MNVKIKYRSVADFGEIITGKTPSTSVDEYWNGEIPFITPTDIVGYDMRYIFNTERQITDAGANSQINTLLPKNSICVTCIASIGKMCITSAAKSITNQQINSIVVKKGYDYRYLFYLLRYFLPYIQLIGGGTGSGTPIISKTKFSKLKYPICEDSATQSKIAAVLSMYDSLIEVNNKRIKVLEQMAENVYKEWFVRFRFPGHETNEFENDIPKEWNISRVCEIGEVVGGGTPSTDRPEFWSGSIPWLSPADLASFENVFISSGESFITEEGMKQSSTKLLPKNTVLLSSRAPIGYVAIAKNEICTNQGFKSVICDPEKVSPFYLFYFFKNNKDLLECFASGSTFLELSGGRLKKIKLVVPPIDIQNKFARIIEPWLNQTELLIEENNNLIKQRDLLLPRLMSGKLEV